MGLVGSISERIGIGVHSWMCSVSSQEDDDVKAGERASRGAIRLRKPFLAMVVVQLAAIGICVVVGLEGISRLDATINRLVVQDAQFLLQATHIRRLFRTELLLSSERRALDPGPQRDEIDRKIQQTREERSALLGRLKAYQEPEAQAALPSLERAHVESEMDPFGTYNLWEGTLANLLEKTEGRFLNLLRETERHVTAARRLLIVGSLSALVTALALGALVLRRVRQAGERLVRHEEQFRRVVESASSLLVVLSPTRRPIFMSPQAPVFLGHSEAALADDFFVWVKPDDRASVAQNFDECLNAGNPIQGLRVHAVRADGSEWYAGISLARVQWDTDGEILMQILDISAQCKAEVENRKLEARLRQVQKMESIGLLASGVAHDFNNLLTAIKGYASLLANEANLDASMAENVEGIQSAADRAGVLTRKLLSFSRKQVIDLRPTRLNEVVRGMERLLARILGENVRLEVRSTPEPHVCLVDVSQVEQIIMNLAVNARQAMPDGGLLIIETSNVVLGDDYVRSHPDVKPGLYVQLMVSDTGTGMPPEVQQRAFEPFFTTKPAGRGTGLGLSVVYGAVRQQGGHISLYSEVGVGTTFKIYWPAIDDKAAEVVPAPVPVIRPVLNELLLLVEDDALVRSFARRALKAQGYQVIDADTAETALSLARSLPSPPALLITDVILPGRHGPDLAQALREIFPDLPVLFCSGYSEQLMCETGHLPPGASLLQKPYDMYALVARVREILSHKPA